MHPLSVKKTKIILIFCGVTIGVCLIFKYLLPIVTPFVVALIVAATMEKPVNFLTKKFRWKRIVSVMTVFLTGIAVFSLLIFFGGRILIKQVTGFINKAGTYFEEINGVVENCCDGIDDSFKLDDGTSMEFVSKQIESASEQIETSVLPAIMNGSMNMISKFAMFFTAVAFWVMATIFLSRDMPHIRAGTKASLFCEEILFFTERMKLILGTFVKTQLIIMGLTGLICTVGLYLVGNPYAFMLGVLIGIVDALPILGTGTVFIPWIIILAIMGRYSLALSLLVIYILCYYLRQFLEPRLMGAELGISPVIMLISFYVGLKLFGILGVITGPIAAIMIKEISLLMIKKLVESRN